MQRYDTQQRLTTLSILLRACYDSLPVNAISADDKKTIDADMESILFFKRSPAACPVIHTDDDTVITDGEKAVD